MIKQVEFMGLNLTLMGTREKISLEKALGNQSPLNFIFNSIGGAMIGDGVVESDVDYSRIKIPPLSVMTIILHASAQKLNNGIALDKMMDLIDSWLEQQEGRSVIELFPIVMEVLQTGKYLPSDEKESKEEGETIIDCFEACE
ncbi:hypothetical protein [Turicibacter sanguinis]|uniref:hypothetical protein n=1 Tax=Turicibacter sanguinis TaxID=154288 RepID=UPI0018AB7EEF|nr:hypothetical protein [Turicibacter sanguinis]MDB8553968.1 hypothetical protein [Turicibacter sanguinis]